MEVKNAIVGGDKADEIIDKTKEFVKDAGDNVSKKVSDLTGKDTEKLREIKDRFRDQDRNQKSFTLKETELEGSSSSHTGVVGKIEDAMDSAKGLVGDLGHKISGLFSNKEELDPRFDL